MEGNTLRSVRSRQTYAAMAGMHGPRLATYATQINPLDIITVLGHDPRSEKRRFLTDQKIVELSLVSGNRPQIFRYSTDKEQYFALLRVSPT